MNCPNNEYVQIMKENGAKICIKKSQYQELNACELGSIISEEEKKYICNKCINNSELVYDEDLNKNKCICKEGYFFDASQEKCRKCDELNPGCLKCDATLTNGGYYFNCYQCDKFYAKDGGHCFYCYGNCEECNIKEDGSQESLKYKEPFFYLIHLKLKNVLIIYKIVFPAHIKMKKKQNYIVINALKIISKIKMRNALNAMKLIMDVLYVQMMKKD